MCLVHNCHLRDVGLPVLLHMNVFTWVYLFRKILRILSLSPRTEVADDRGVLPCLLIGEAHLFALLLSQSELDEVGVAVLGLRTLADLDVHVDMSALVHGPDEDCRIGINGNDDRTLPVHGGVYLHSIERRKVDAADQ